MEGASAPARPSRMRVSGSRPSMGKSSLMLNIVEYISVYREVPTLIFSGEMSGFQIVQRLVLSKALFPIGQVWSGYEFGLVAGLDRCSNRRIPYGLRPEARSYDTRRPVIAATSADTSHPAFRSGCGRLDCNAGTRESVVPKRRRLTPPPLKNLPRRGAGRFPTSSTCSNGSRPRAGKYGRRRPRR